jgi:PKD repeat protein
LKNLVSLGIDILPIILVRRSKKVKEKVEDRMLRDLFRQKLENAEIIPSPEADIRIMRQVGRREFLRFNPSRFNIWYAGGIAVAGTALAIILASVNHKNSLSVSSEINIPTEVSKLNPGETEPSGNYFKLKAHSPEKESAKRSERTVKTKTGKTSEKANPINPGSDNVSPHELGSINGKDIIKGNEHGANILREQNLITGSMASASVIEGCSPLKVLFKNRLLKCDSCRWTFGDGGSSTEKNPQWLFDIPGEYNITLMAFAGDHHYSSTLTVTVHNTPKARFEFSPENAILPSDEITFHNYSSDALKYKWSFGDGSSSELIEPSHIYRNSGHYNLKLVAITEFGCTDSVVVINAFSGSGNYIEFPNAFIPNLNGPSTGYYSSKSDESAQVFHPVISSVSEYQLRIFSRKGILIFESNDINIGWDGYYKGQLCDPGVYIWKVRGNYLNGEPFTKMGDVTLLKN